MKPSAKICRGITWLSVLTGMLAMGALLLSPLATSPNAVAAQNAGGIQRNSGLEGAAADVFVRFNPAHPSVMQDDIFFIEIQIAAGSQPVDGVEVHVDFNPTHLQVVDAAGNPASQIEGGASLDVTIVNTVNNAEGKIDFAAGTFGDAPSGTFVLATIRFKALAGTGGGSTLLTFVSRGGSPTNVTYAGGSVLTGVENGSVTIGGETATTTPTHTPTPTATSTTTPVATLTDTATPSPTATRQRIVFLDLNPANPSVAKDQVFTVDIRISAGSQPVDGAEVHLDFDPLYLQVVDGAGNPASQIEGGASLDVTIVNTVNNAEGKIDFAAGTFGDAPSGTFVLATVRFKALWGTGGGSTPLSFVSRQGNPTDVTYGGGSVLSGVSGGSVTISGATPAPTPTRTATATPTRTLTNTPTGTPTLTRTPTSTPLGVRETLEFQKGLHPGPAYSGVEDTFLNLWAEDVVHGGEVYMVLRSDGAKRSLIKFDLSEHIPLGSPVTQATLYLWMYDSSNDNPINTDVFRVNRYWEERTATWNYPWSVVGCDGVPADREETSAAVSRLRQEGQWVWWDVTAPVQGWVSGVRSNEGLLLIVSPGQQHRSVYFRSSNWHNWDQRPKLLVEFYRLPPTPTPTQTATPTVSPTPTETSIPTPTPTVTPVPGRIEGQVWDDVNGNGLIDAGEAGLAGATIRLYDHGHLDPDPPLRPPVVTGPNGTFHFDGVPPGRYVLVETNPPGYLSSTSDVLSILVTGGVTSYGNFGDQRISALLPIVIVHRR